MVFELVLCLLAVASAEVEVDEGVFVLGDASFDEFVAANDFVLAEFYAPWCGHCKTLAPEYAKAAQALAEADSPVKLAKIDATEEKAVAEKFEVRGFPTLKFVRSGEAVDYTGGRTADEIIAWVNKKSGPPAVTLETAEDIEAFKKQGSVVMVGFFSDVESDEAKAFLETAASKEGDSAPFGIVTADVGASFDVTAPGVVIFQDFDEGRADFSGDISVASLKKFLLGNLLPIVVDFSDETAQKIFQGEIKNHFLFFADKATDMGWEGHKETLMTLGKTYKGEALFVRVDVGSAHEGMLNFFGVSKDDVPAVYMVTMRDQAAPLKYKPTDLTPDTLAAFAKSVLSGEAKPHLKSAPVPEQEGPVVVLVSSTFDEIVFDPEKDVLVEFYAPWCGHCKKLAPIWDELAEKYADNDNVVIAKMDSTENELEDIEVSGFPTLKFFPRGEGKEVVDYDGGRELNDLASFIESHIAQDGGDAHDEL